MKLLDVDPLSVAKSNFGFQCFRPGQEKAIRSIVSGQDSLVVMPTGSGKSAIYQVSGLMLEGTVLVISPLIALQKDQVDSIESMKSGQALLVNSTLRASELHECYGKLATKACKFVFLAPEQLTRAEAIDALQQAGVALIAIDEAHCISEWGHNFRPDYLQLGHVIETLGHPITVAMTATAAQNVREEIITRLGLQNPFVYVGGFDRPNIRLKVDRFTDKEGKFNSLIESTKDAEKPGVIYVGTRKSAEAVVHNLQSNGVEAIFYHGGMKAAERHEIQDRFMSDTAEVIVATNAFGMGIDKPNVRFVFHLDAPESLDSYYQEIGRAGRDGQPAIANLFFCPDDIGVHMGVSDAKADIDSKAEMDELTHLAGTIEAAASPLSVKEIAGRAKVSPRKVTSAIQKLEEAEVIEVLPSGEVQLEEDVDWQEASEFIAERTAIQKTGNRKRLEQMLAYAESDHCRRASLLNYFGEEIQDGCENCDICCRD